VALKKSDYMGKFIFPREKRKYTAHLDVTLIMSLETISCQTSFNKESSICLPTRRERTTKYNCNACMNNEEVRRTTRRSIAKYDLKAKEETA
jgi:hypothetical protein